VAAAVAAVPRPDRRDALAAAGYVAPQWPPPYGLGAAAGDVLVIDEELARAGLSRPDLVIGGWAGLAVVRYGSAGQRDRFLGPTLRGEITWCQLFSEPEAGSDLAAVATRAERVPAGQDGPAGWRLTGQKVWTSLAHEAGWAICLARTDPAAPKHRGITFFLVDMRSPGIGIRPLREITGRAMFNEVFLDGVFVPDDCVLGECGEGWRIARTALAAERVAMAQGPALGEAAEGLIAVIRAAGRPDDPAVLEQAGALIADGLAGTLLDLRSALAQLSGTDAGPLAAVRKLVMPAHHDVRPKDLDAKRLGAVLALAHERHLRDFASFLLLEQLGPRTLQSLALVAEVVHGTPTRFADPARFSFAHGGKDGHPFPVPLRIYDESIAVLRRALDAAKVGDPDKLQGFSRLDKFTRAIERRCQPAADVDATIAHERAISPALGGRTVFDDRPHHRPSGRASAGRTPAPHASQLDLFAD